MSINKYLHDLLRFIQTERSAVVYLQRHADVKQSEAKDEHGELSVAVPSTCRLKLSPCYQTTSFTSSETFTWRLKFSECQRFA